MRFSVLSRSLLPFRKRPSVPSASVCRDSDRDFRIFASWVIVGGGSGPMSLSNTDSPRGSIG